MINLEEYLRDVFLKAITKLVDTETETNLIKDSDISGTKYADFQYNGLVRIMMILKKLKPGEIFTLQSIEAYLKTHIKEFDHLNIIDKLELSKNFINIVINNDFLLKSVSEYFDQSVNLKAEVVNKNIAVDYSSPNVAKSLHIGHLRSTIIGESIVRLLKRAGYNVTGFNHIGDWGTQFGMIINYLKTKYEEAELFDFLLSADSNNLMNIYREAKKMFDESAEFATESRNQTYKLQQGDEFNTKIWRLICAISSKEYSEIYKTLNIKHLVEKGESSYQHLIPKVLQLLDDSGLTKIEDGAKLIMLEKWTYPLMVVKSDGGYTYDTTDLAALYHRLVELNFDEVIYVTDSGQKSHFEMCFEVANKMGWTSDSKRLTHIGFGLVCGKDGSKLKTRSGDVVKMLDVIDEVKQLAFNVVLERSRIYKENVTSQSQDPTHEFYRLITEDQMKELSRKIGLNTLKYFDLSHNFESNYKYDPELMFRFNGDTGVYLMYCLARINSIVEKSTIKDPFLDLNYPCSKETHDLLVHINNFTSCIETATKNFNTNKLTNYVYNLCTLFNSFIGQKNGKILGSEFESVGIMICLIVSSMIKEIFNILSFEEVEHI